MAGWFDRVALALAGRHRQWRRARNLRAGTQRPARPAARWVGAGGVLVALAGAVIIAGHARHLGRSAPGPLDTGVPSAVDILPPALAGMGFTVPKQAGVTMALSDQGAIVIAAGMHAADPVRVNLCDQVQGARMLPLRIGYQFDDVARLVARSEAGGKLLTIRNVALASDMPQVQINGLALPAGGPLQVSWQAAGRKVRWASDAGSGAFRRDGFLVWSDGALRVQRRAAAACKSAGELVLQLYRNGDGGAAKALVTAFPAGGDAISTWLPPGSYRVPAAPRASLEDQALFQQLAAHGLLRLGDDGLIELAPRDLASWQAAPGSARSGELGSWQALASDAAATMLFKRLYRMADGAYVREQVRIFNNERRLLAWRVRPALAGAVWQASVAGASVATGAELPLAAARLFADVPQGWAPWNRVAAWPAGGPDAAARLVMQQPRAGQRIELLLVGRVLGVEGARMLAPPRAACSGRACPAPGAVQLVVLEALPGAASIALTAAPLAMDALAGADAQYRHLSVAGGKLAWRALAANSATARRADPAGVVLQDRHGVEVWSGGAPSAAAIDAGLAPLLGLRAEHASSVAGMLARVPSPSGEPHRARLSLDLALQKASHDALDCIGMRRGRWDGARCTGAMAVPPGRQAGIVILDTDNGDILAAAGAGGGVVDAANWNEVRDFDRANPARSPLRLPAFQHDGGAYRSPGSTFKIVSALGLELAAQRDAQLDMLLAGMPLAALNRVARAKGFAFQTNAASYPFGTRLAHITNYKDQHLDRRAQDGRMGLAQALTYSLNTWFAWSGELSDRSLFGRADGGAPDLQALEPGSLDSVRPIAAMAHKVGFGQQLRLDGGLLPADFRWSPWDALQPSEAHIDPIHTRHELRQMAIGLRMQVTPLHMAMVAGAIGEGRVIAPRLLLELDARAAHAAAPPRLGVRLDRIRAGMKGVVDAGTAAAAFRGAPLDAVRRGLAGKTGTSPAMVTGPDGVRRELATVWFTGYLEPGSVPGQRHRLAVAAFVSHSEASGGEHAAPIVASVLGSMAGLNREQKGK
ncbi:penicillin-binding transpeptidase domain-containing protein [Massilia sp. TSP1-1-2]|uniref:penicillin-binding transpeptidase domain-containing protein n=1 Tax=Massilia sp. TSP1-1-2 TaxID=2804649 RepID=UPI003CE98FD8